MNSFKAVRLSPNFTLIYFFLFLKRLFFIFSRFAVVSYLDFLNYLRLHVHEIRNFQIIRQYEFWKLQRQEGYSGQNNQKAHKISAKSRLFRSPNPMKNWKTILGFFFLISLQHWFSNTNMSLEDQWNFCILFKKFLNHNV